MIYDAEDTDSGRLYADDQAFFAEKLFGSYKLILLSSCEKVSGFFSDVGANGRPLFWVMLVSQNGLVSERMGVGFVFMDRIDHFMGPGKVWTEIILA